MTHHHRGPVPAPQGQTSGIDRAQEASWWGWISLARSGIFFVFFGLYVWLFIRPELFYHAFGVTLGFPTFATDVAFLRSHLGRPGGLVEYISALLSQAYYYSWLGAVVITLLAWLIWAGTRKLIGLAGEPRAKFLSYVPILLLLAMYNGGDHVLTTSLALCAAIWFSVGCEALPLGGGVLRTVFYVVVFGLCYWTAGGASLIFVLLVSAYECFGRRRLLSGVLNLVLGLAVPWLLAAHVFDLAMADAYLRLLPVHPEISEGAIFPGAAVCVYLSVLLAVLSAMLCHTVVVKKLSSRIAGLMGKWGPGDTQRTSRRWQDGKLKCGLHTMALVLAFALSVFLSSGRREKNLLWITFYSHHRMWPEVINQARNLPRGFYHPAFTHEANRALYHSGRLGHEMFSFPQAPYTLLFFPIELDYFPWRHRRTCDILLDLGDVNGAEWQAFEALEGVGGSPAILEKLALISIVKGQTETAKVFLNAQSKDLIYGARARRILRRLAKDPRLDGDRDVQRLRSSMPDEDFVLIWYGAEEALLLRLLERNPFNRMAFEYLMAYYLLTHQLQKFVEGIELLDNFDYGDEMPTHYEEAILVYTSERNRTVDMHGRSIRPASVERFRRFTEVAGRYKHDEEEARRRLAPQFGRSYYFYRAFAKSGVWQ